jgi:hypothetical protein
MKRLLVCIGLLGSLAFAQDTRSAIFGKVLDPQAAAVPAATVVVTNVETNTEARVKSNETGYYEVNALMPGMYRVSAEAAGFKTTVQKDVSLPVSTRREVVLNLEVGTTSENITVEANAVILDTDSVSTGRAIDNHSVMELPSMGNNAVLLAQLTPGIQTSGTTGYMGLHSNLGASDYNVFGNVGGNDWTLDGAPNVGQQRRMAYLPYNDAIAEFKVDTSNFDASVGHTTGVSITMMTKSGTNQFHGTATWQYWNARWNGTPFFSNKSYYTNLNTALILGDTQKAAAIQAAGSQAAGHSHNYAGTIGGPVRIPKLLDGRNKLFFFFAFNGFKDLKTDDPTTFNHTVPTMPERGGDFSDLLKIATNASQYIIYDPLSTVADPTRSGHVVRTAFPNNVIPSSRLNNPMMNYYTKIMPEPNNLSDPSQPPVNDYFAGRTPWNWDFKSFSNRYDYNANDRHKFFGRWLWEDFYENRNDWLYETAPGLNSNGLVRHTLNGSLGWTWSLGSGTVIDAQGSVNEYIEGSKATVATAIKPSDVGLPSYMDAQAGAMHVLPYASISNYTSGTSSQGFAYLPTGYPSLVHYRTASQKLNATHVRGQHTFRAGVELREYFKTGGGGGATSGSFTFGNNFTQRTDDGFTPAANLGLAWASFEMGFPGSYSESITTPLALSNKYSGFYGSDTWRVSSRLTLTLGLRAEYETGGTERYNRLLGQFDPTINLGAFATDAQNAYAAVLSNPANASNSAVQFLQSYLPASAFKVAGGYTYAGVNGAPRNVYQGQLMWLPRLGWAYQIGTKTVFRGGYGLYYDTNNVLPSGFSSGLFNSSTNNPALTNDFGQTWNVGNPKGGASILSDPFPAIYNGQRFISPVGTAYGPLASIGGGGTFTSYNWEHARQQRWHLGFQRQLQKDLLLEVSYDGSYSDRISLTRTISPIPAQFYNFSSSRNDAAASFMSASVPNPFKPANFSDIQASNPTLYNNLINSSGFFTSNTIQVQQLIRAFPQMNGISRFGIPDGAAKTNGLTVSVNRRFARGFMLDFGYAYLNTMEDTNYLNSFNTEPYWRLSNNGRPHRITVSGVYQLPFGKGRRFLKTGVPNVVLGGWEIAGSYQYQPGPLIGWSTTLFYNGDPGNICSGGHTLSQWFNTSGFVTASSAQATSFQAAVFPSYIGGCRADNTNLLNASAMRDFRFFDRGSLQIRLDALNVANHPQFSGPNTSPTSGQFGQITSQTSQINRLIEIQARVVF